MRFVSLISMPALKDRQPDVGFIAELASECFMPLSYGGAIKSVADATPIFAAGVEKVVLGRASNDPVAVRALADSFGSQAVAACIDCRRVTTVGAWLSIVDVP